MLRFKSVIFFALSSCLFFFFPVSGHAQEINDAHTLQYQELIRELRKCGVSQEQFTVGVIPASNANRIMTESQINYVRSEIQRGLQGFPNVRPKPIEDYAQIIDFTTEGERSDEELRAFLKTSRTLDVLITFEPLEMLGQEGKRETFRTHVKGITIASTCSAIVAFDFDTPSSQLQSLQRLFDDFSRKLVGAQRRSSYRVSSFRQLTDARSECDDAMRDRFVSILQEKCTGGLTDKKCPDVQIDVEDESPQPEKTDAVPLVTVSGEYGLQKSETGKEVRLWVKLRASNGQRILQQTAREWVIRPDCNAEPNDVFQLVRQGANTNTAKLSISSRSVFKVGDDAEFKIFSYTSGHLYCWYLDADRYAYILTPTKNAQADKRQNSNVSRVFPQDFYLGAQSFHKASHDLFACMLPPRDLSRDPTPDKGMSTHEKWVAKQGTAGSGPDGALTEAEWRPLIEEMRRIRGLTEAFADVIIEPK